MTSDRPNPSVGLVMHAAFIAHAALMLTTVRPEQFADQFLDLKQRIFMLEQWLHKLADEIATDEEKGQQNESSNE